MQRTRSRLFSVLVLSAVIVGPAPHARTQGTPIGFAEQFALASDRGKVLEQLIPGTEDYYYYQCLHRQNTGALAEVEPLLRTWIQRYGRRDRVDEIENRQALLGFAQNPAATFSFLQQRLGLRFDAERQSSGQKPDLPTRLDPSLLSPAVLTQRALALHPGSVDGFTASAFDGLVSSNLDDALLMSLLRRLERPDLPNLPALIARNLQSPHSRGFGSLPIHKQLLLDQLEQLARLQPPLLDHAAFLAEWLHRLQPDADVQWRRDGKAREAWLDRLWTFAQRLSPAHNSLKAHVLYHRLVHDQALGTFDKPRFLAYLRLPRQQSYSNPDYLKKNRGGNEVVDPAKGFATGLPPIGDDEPLVRSCFEHFFAQEDSFQPYAEFVQAAWLRRLFAETRILLGTGEMERWYSMLDDPAYYEQLKDRVEIRFPPQQRTDFLAADPVAIDVDTKNVGTLLVKVFEIDAFEFQKANNKDVDASIDLDGMVANAETTYPYTDNPLRRVRRHFDFPALARAGTYVVEFIGNGLSSRALIKKGRLQFIARAGSAGQVFRVLDEAGLPLPEASLWCGGHDYGADEHGEINVPYAPKRQQENVILRHGALATLESFDHFEEQYELAAGVLVARESLLAGQQARVLVRPLLSMHGVPVSLQLLEQPELTIAAVDLAGVPATLAVRDLKFAANGEWVQPIAVPATLSKLAVTLRGRVRNLGQRAMQELASQPQQFELAGIDATPQTGCPLLGRTADGYVLDLFGKNGEPLPDRAIGLRFAHRDFTDPSEVALKTDGKGRIQLGSLDGIVALQAAGFPAEIGAFSLCSAERSWPRSLHGAAAALLRVPYQGRSTTTERAAVSLLELRDATFTHDAFDHVALANGFVELRGLAPGDYDLWLKEADQHIAVKITAGTARAGWIIGRDRLLQTALREPLQVQSLAVAGTELRIQLANATAQTRVHVFATRYLEPYAPFNRLSVAAAPDLETVLVQHSESSLHAGREIGDEYRYILDRRLVKKFPGNMLHRPGLLLNPWALDESASAIGNGRLGGGKYGSRFGGERKAPAGTPPAREQNAGLPPGIFPNLEFLPAPARLLANLTADKDGRLRVALADLGPGQLVHVVAVDDTDTVCTTLPLPEQPLVPQNRRLTDGLDPGQHFSEQQRIDFVATGGTAVVDDVTTATTETYDSLATVFRLLQTLSKDSDLDEFAFVLRWPQLTPKEQLELYGKHACHELHFFLHQKDRVFFDRVVRPYLANKLHKTFLDQWLLDLDLARWLEPWAFARLNIVEQILLTQRIAGEGAAGSRHVRELFELLPVDPERAMRLFAVALDSGGLAADHAKVTGRPEGAEQVPSDRERGLAAPQAPKPAAAPPAEEKRKDEQAAKAAADEPAAEQLEQDKKLQEQQVDDLSRRALVRELYRGPGPTRAYVEHDYWHRRIAEQNADLIKVNGFWRDFVDRKDGVPFCSQHLAEAAGSFAEMMFALSVLDLPFTAGQHVTERAGNRMTLRAASPLLFVRREIRPAAPAAAASPVLISQNFFRLDDRYRFEGSERLDNFVTGEFLTAVAYGCQVVLTNPTSTPRKLELLLQIPRGALPVQRGFRTRGVAMQLDPFATRSFEYAFYFPEPGTFAHYPAHVARDGTLIAFAPPVTMTVLTAPSQIDTTSWEHVSQDADAKAVLAWLDANNLQRTDLPRIAWRLRDRAFFGLVLDRLRHRHVYDQTLWSYGLLHGDAAATREYLRHADAFVARCGRLLVTPLLVIDPRERLAWQLIEYDPLFNARAHRFGRQREILDRAFAGQYQSLCDILAYKPQLDDTDWMGVTCYLLLQDRTEEALAGFAHVDRTHLATAIQYDYLRAYLDFFTDDHAQARGIAEQYREHPVPRWRAMFQDVLGQLDEAEGKAVATSDRDDRTRRQTALAASEPALDLLIEGRRVTIRHQNLERATVNYYQLDVEFSFSTSPFVQQGAAAFSFIRPNRSDAVVLAAGQQETAFDLPPEFRSSNVLVEVRGGGITRRQSCFANALAVQTIETYGQLETRQAVTGKPLPKVYVKVYARLPGGRVRFHKDGYTDLRGRFDYASVSDPGNAAAERFAILLLSDTDGAMVREVAPPGK